MSDAAGNGAGEVRATVYHRTGSRERRRVADVVDELDDLRRRSALSDYECRAWPDTVPMDRDSTPVEVYRTVVDWADRHGASVEPPFRVASVSSSILHVSDEVLRTPEVCVTLRGPEGLRTVFPHATTDDVVTVRDGLRRLSSELADAAPDDAGEDAVGRPDGHGTDAPTT